MTDAELATAIEGTVEMRDLQIRQVGVGQYIFVATRRFTEPENHSTRLSVQYEGVASNDGDAMAAIQRFYSTGQL